MTIALSQTVGASALQMCGAFGFGLMLGWFLYFVNRYRKEVLLGDLTVVIGAVGGAGILALFPAKTDLFGAYGVGLAVGFFGYLLILVALVSRSDNFDFDYLIDGRRKTPTEPFAAGDKVDRPMEARSGSSERRTPKGT